MKHDFRIGVMEADIDSAVRCRLRSAKPEPKSFQLHTGECVIWMQIMTRQGLLELDTSDVESLPFLVKIVGKPGLSCRI